MGGVLLLRCGILAFPGGRGATRAFTGPGVYLFFAESVREVRSRLQVPEDDGATLLAGVLEGRLPRPVYVGKAKSLRARLRSYFKPGDDGKARRVKEAARCVAVLRCDTHFLAWFLEILLIRSLRPPLNVVSTARSRTIFFARQGTGTTISVRGLVPHVRATLGFSSSSIQVQEVLTTLAAVGRSLEAGMALVFFPGRRFKQRTEFSPREFAMTEPLARDFHGFFHGRPGPLLARVEERMKEEAAALRFGMAAKWRDALFLLRRFAAQLVRSRRILRGFRHEASFEIGEARIRVSAYEVRSIVWECGTVLPIPLSDPRDPEDDDTPGSGRNLTRGLRIHYELLRLMDAWHARGEERCRLMRRRTDAGAWSLHPALARGKKEGPGAQAPGTPATAEGPSRPRVAAADEFKE